MIFHFPIYIFVFHLAKMITCITAQGNIGMTNDVDFLLQIYGVVWADLKIQVLMNLSRSAHLLQQQFGTCTTGVVGKIVQMGFKEMPGQHNYNLQQSGIFTTGLTKGDLYSARKK
ncbi:hypothetical protein ACJX0J_017404, partial [Zea mays]